MDTITRRLPPELIRYIKEYIPKKHSYLQIERTIIYITPF